MNAIKTGYAAIGQTTNDYWNVCSRDGVSAYDWLTFVAVSNLLTADRSLSAVGLTLSNAPGAWVNGSSDPMYNSYLYPFNGGNLTVQVTNLPLGAYDIYVYGHGNVSQGGMGNLNGVYQLTSGTNNYGTFTTATNGTNWESTDWQEGQQYVVFRGVTVSDSAQPVVVTGLPGVGGEALIAGMQIAQKVDSNPALRHVIFGRPVLKMSMAYGSLLLSWPATASGFVLESNDGTALGKWIAVPATPVTNGTEITVTLPSSATGNLYRLRHL